MTAWWTALRQPRALAFVVCASVVLVDQVAKGLALRVLAEPVPLVPGFALRLSYNTGAAFSTGSGLTPLITLIASTVVVSAVLVAPRVVSHRWAVAGGLVVGGAAGNLVDRLIRPPGFARGAVVDYLDVSWFAVFNLADVALSCGAALWVLLTVRGVPALRERPGLQGEP